jgi:serine kinase of HPr protein (carbohydrate metabolism regulator)
MEHETVHGTCVTLGRSAALIRGPSGAGKSDLALRFLFLARRGPAAIEAPKLVSDDQVMLSVRDGQICVRPPATIAGKLEVRGVGIVEVKWAQEADLVLVVDLVTPDQVERMPPDERVQILGVPVRRLRLAPFEASAPIKLAAGIAMARGETGH